MDFSCLLFTMHSRRAVPFLIPTIALHPRQLLLYDPRPPRTYLKSTLLQVFILENLKTFGINNYEKQGGGTAYGWYRPGTSLTEQTGSIPDTARTLVVACKTSACHGKRAVLWKKNFDLSSSTSYGNAA